MKELSNTEKIVMKCIYDAGGPVSCRDILLKLKKEYGRDYAETTVYTFIKNIRLKGYITSYKQGVTYYSPTIDKDEMLNNEIKSFVGLWFNGDKDDLIRYLQI